MLSAVAAVLSLHATPRAQFRRSTGRMAVSDLEAAVLSIHATPRAQFRRSASRMAASDLDDATRVRNEA